MISKIHIRNDNKIQVSRVNFLNLNKITKIAAVLYQNSSKFELQKVFKKMYLNQILINT